MLPIKITKIADFAIAARILVPSSSITEAVSAVAAFDQLGAMPFASSLRALGLSSRSS
jgi:hypothetical protein